MKKNTYLALGLSLGLGLVAVAGASPAFAFPSVTSFQVSPTVFRGGDAVTLTINGQTSGSFTFIGCVVTFFNGLPYVTTDVGPTEPPYVAGTISADIINRYAEDLTYQGEAFSGACSSLTPSDTPVWSTNVLTITPQLAIDPVSLVVGSDAPVTASYTTASPSGLSPFDWGNGYGGDFRELDPSSCSVLFPVSIGDSQLPSGVTISDAQSPSGSAPSLVLDGAPAAGSEGTYKVCVGIEDGNGQPAAAWMNVTVASALPATGFDTPRVIVAAGVAALLALVGALLVVVRRRSRA